MDAKQIGSLERKLRDLSEQFRSCFRGATFRHFLTYLLGLMDDMPRKNVEAIALAANVPVRSLQEFLSQHRWDDHRVHERYQRMVADEQGCEQAIGVIDASGHPKQGEKTPGVQRQYCGQTGKIDNCVVGVHLLYTDNHATNPFSCMLDSELYLPARWDRDDARREEAGIPAEKRHQPEWQLGVNMLLEALANGIRLSWVSFDESFGQVPAFWFALDRLGLRGSGEVPANFRCWPTPPKYRSLQGPWASKPVASVVRRSAVFRDQGWRTVEIDRATRQARRWRYKAARVQLVDRDAAGRSCPTERRYWLVVADNEYTGERKYLVSNASAAVTAEAILRAGFARWHVEKWFERAKQWAGFGSFEVRKYVGLVRHWLCSRIAMYFLASQTQRFRGGKSADHTGAGGAFRGVSAAKGGELLAAHVA
jgi:SRSO17 transposase